MQKRRVVGKLAGKVEVAKQMLVNGFNIKDIRELTGLTDAEIEKLRDQEE
ncbi:hypothetical protein RJD24_07630 [Bacillaceae bacterium IKA-2]|nr:hypothetical protein RJD24_07630 [Bacillaceae bacterium IKA-2]